LNPTSAIVIPARYASTRFPGKPLADLCGKPMLEHVIERARAVRGIRRVLVATDDERILRLAVRAGAEAKLTRADHPSGTDRIAVVARELDEDLIINLQGDEPLIDPAAIEALIAAMAADPALSMATLVTPLTDPARVQNPNVVKVVIDRRGFALYFSRTAIPFERSGGSAALFQHIGVYGYRREFLLRLVTLEQTPLELAEGLEQLRALEWGWAIRCVETAWHALAVDTPEQLEEVQRRMRAET
jgi:3-deoxy-manno-octulosonate cytidylyltransferase (CMP-KDO synthetase)